MGKFDISSWKICVSTLVFLVGFLLLFGSGFALASGNVEGSTVPPVAVTPTDLVFTSPHPEEAQSKKVDVYIKTDDETWEIYIKAIPEAGNMPILDALFLRKIGENKETPMKDENTGEGAILLLASGQTSFNDWTHMGDFTLTVRPGWTLPPGEYNFELRFAYYRGRTDTPAESTGASVKVQVTIEPSFQIGLDVTPEAGLAFEIQGPPGRYLAQNTISLSGIANVPGWGMVLHADDLTGEKGGVIPNSRIVVPVEIGVRKYEFVSLKDGLLLEGGQAGELISHTIDELYIDTLIEDAPDIYEGRLYVEVVYPGF